jgi:hypothetical protein
MEAVEHRRHTKLWSFAEVLGRAKLEWVVVLIGLANVVVLLVQVPAIAHGVYLNSDNASALVLPALASHAAAGSVINLGDHPWYEMWWLMRSTAGLPHYRQVWESLPFVIGLLGIAAVTATAWWVGGRLAGLLCAVTLIAASASMRGILYVPETRVPLVLHAGVLCAWLLFMRERLRTKGLSRSVLLIAILFVLFTGAGCTDQLVILGGLVPFVLAPILCWIRSGSSSWRQLSLYAVIAGIASLVIAAVLTHIMNQNHVIHAPFPLHFASSASWVANGQNLLASFASLAGGSFYEQPVSDGNLLTFVLGGLAIIALLGTLRATWHWGGWRQGSVNQAPSRDQGANARDLFIFFWALVLVVVIAAYLLTTLSGTVADSRYLLGPWVAVAALLGVFATASGARVAVTVAVCVFGVLIVRANLVEGVPAYGVAPNQRVAGEIEHYVQTKKADVGFSGYWDAAPVTWETDLHIRIYPIQACNLATGYCPFYNNEISSWYARRSAASTFLLTDSQPGDPLAVTAPPSAFGRPSSAAAFGPYTVYVYNHDLTDDLS